MNLSDDQKLIVVFITITLGLTAVYPEALSSALGLALSSALFGLTLWLSREEETRYEDLEEKIRVISDKLEAMQIQRGMGR